MYVAIAFCWPANTHNQSDTVCSVGVKDCEESQRWRGLGCQLGFAEHNNKKKRKPHRGARAKAD